MAEHRTVGQERSLRKIVAFTEPVREKKRRLFLGAVLRRVAIVDERRRDVAEHERDSDRFEKMAEKTVHLSGILIGDELAAGF